MLLGPSIASLLLTGHTAGKVGFREILSRLLRWRPGARWYVVALLTAPLSTAVVLLVLSFFSPAFTPNILTADDKATAITMNISGELMEGTKKRRPRGNSPYPRSRSSPLQKARWPRASGLLGLLFCQRL